MTVARRESDVASLSSKRLARDWNRPYSDPIRNIDWIHIAAIAALAVIGVFTVYSATHLRLIDQGFDPFVYTQRQVIFLIVAAGAMSVMMWLGHEWLRAQAALAYGGVLLGLVLVPVFGAVTGGARLAIDFGPVSLQPAEFAKPVVIVLVAAYVADASKDQVDWHHFVMSLIGVIFPLMFILIQPDLGSASVVIAGFTGLMYAANARRRYLLLIAAMTAGSIAVSIAAVPRLGYQLRRFDAWLNQNSFDPDLQKVVLQVRFAKRAVSTGGFNGQGYLQGPLTNGKYIPVQFTDFPFSAIGEQFGMIGGLVVLSLFGVLLWRIWVIARAAADRFSRLLGTAIFCMMLWQTFQNIGMALGVTPVSGIPLPFISYGGSHLLGSAILMGLVQSIAMRRRL
jgi:rod shape determining protein RodA